MPIASWKVCQLSLIIVLSFTTGKNSLTFSMAYQCKLCHTSELPVSCFLLDSFCSPSLGLCTFLTRFMNSKYLIYLSLRQFFAVLSIHSDFQQCCDIVFAIFVMFIKEELVSLQINVRCHIMLTIPRYFSSNYVKLIDRTR